MCSNPKAPDGTPCNDGNACTGATGDADSCHAGMCNGGDPTVCSASDQCHVAGTCDPATGACSNPNAPDGTPCNDGNACTAPGGDTLPDRRLHRRRTRPSAPPPISATSPAPAIPRRARARTRTPPTARRATTATPAPRRTRHLPGRRLHRRQPGRLRRLRPVPRRRAPAIRDRRVLESRRARRHAVQRRQRLHRQTATRCQAGACTGGEPVVCTASDQCHTRGTCDPATGACSNPNAPNGTRLQRRQRLHRQTGTGDSCRTASAPAANPVVCTASDQCHAAGTCDPATGVCSNPNAAERHALQRRQRLHPDRHLPDGRLHAARNPSSAPPPEQCHVAGTCNPGDRRLLEPERARWDHLH